MRPEDYSSLKSASKVSYAKGTDSEGEEVISLTVKKFDSSTGVAIADVVNEVRIIDYEREKVRYGDDKTKLEAKIAGLTLIITDINAL